jgi:chemotaxis protein CheX
VSRIGHLTYSRECPLSTGPPGAFLSVVTWWNRVWGDATVTVTQAMGERSANMESGPAVAPGIERTLAMLAHQTPRADILEPFVEAARDVLAEELGVDVTPGKLSLASGSATTLDLTVVLGITGRLTGIAVYGMSSEMAMGVVGRMLGSPVSDLDEMALSGIAELGNVITGRATTLLAGMGMVCDISPPMLLLGAGSRLSTMSIQRLVIPLSTELGTLQAQVAIKVTDANAKRD